MAKMANKKEKELPKLNHAQQDFIDGYVKETIEALKDLYGENRKHYVVGELAFAVSPETSDNKFQERMAIISKSTGSGKHTQFANEEAVRTLTRLYHLTHHNSHSLPAFYEFRFDQMGDLSMLKKAIPPEIMHEFSKSDRPKLDWALRFGQDSDLPVLEEKKKELVDHWFIETKNRIVDKVTEYVGQHPKLAQTLLNELEHQKESPNSGSYANFVTGNKPLHGRSASRT